jgi:hypothetical protein
MIHSWQQYSQSKICSGSRVNSRSQSTPTRAPSNRPQSRTNESLACGLSKNAGLRRPLWVKSGRDALILRCPLYPRKRTFAQRSGCLLWANNGHPSDAPLILGDRDLGASAIFPIRFSRPEYQPLCPYNRTPTCRRSRLPERIECPTSRPG